MFNIFLSCEKEKAMYNHLICEGAIIFATKDELMEFSNTDLFRQSVSKLDDPVNVTKYFVKSWECGMRFLSFGSSGYQIVWLYRNHCNNYIKPYSFFKEG